MRLSHWLTCSIVLAVALSTGMAWGFTPRVVLDLTGGGAQVLINDRSAIRFRATNGRLSAAERASITAERLRQLVAAKLNPRTVYAKGTKWQARILAGDKLICVATAADARANHTTPLALANSWASNVRWLLMMRAIILSDRSVTVPLGENRRVTVGGAAAGAMATKVADVLVAAAAADNQARTIQITGVNVGATAVDVECEGERAQISVYVKKYAASVPCASFAEVTGSPCPGSLIKYVAAQAVLRSAALERGAKLEVNPVEGADTALGSGLTRRVKVAVKAVGDGYITYAAQPEVEVHNSIMQADAPQQLFYSNSPERVTRYQVLYAGRLQPDISTRVLYHHQNALGKPVRFLVEIANPNALPATYRITKGVSGPLIDTVLVGYLASLSFVKDSSANASVMERVPPNSRLVVVSDLLGLQETSSGVMQIRQTDGRESYLRIAALPPDVESACAGSITPWQEPALSEVSGHVYPSPAKTIEADYIIGQRWAFISIGKHAIGSHDAQKKLDGNYGVTYDINVKVQNPTTQTKKVRVMFDPTAGLASGVFIIDGRLVSAKYAKPPNEVQLASYELKPGEVRTVRITTLPVAGSNYPANLVVRS